MPFSIAHDHPCLPGHFPGRPVVPGVVVLEHVVAAIESEYGAAGPLRLPQVKFLRPLLPGQVAEVEVTPASAGRWRFRVRHAGDLVASGEVAGGATP
jgi:3-hydroxymyristoyl/3-hydroxydecanoyl-(acyl carrier protein) dehydratase